MTDPTYSARHDRLPIMVGDSIDPFTLRVADDQDVSLIPDSVHCVIRRNGVSVRVVAASINVVTGVVTIDDVPGSATAQWVADKYTYEVVYVVGDRTRTYLQGTITVMAVHK